MHSKIEKKYRSKRERERDREIERGGGVRKIQREIKTKKKTNIRSYSSNVRYPATNKIQLTR